MCTHATLVHMLESQSRAEAGDSPCPCVRVALSRGMWRSDTECPVVTHSLSSQSDINDPLFLSSEPFPIVGASSSKVLCLILLSSLSLLVSFFSVFLCGALLKLCSNNIQQFLYYLSDKSTEETFTLTCKVARIQYIV